MYRSLCALAVIAALILGNVVPASAQSWFKFRISPSGGTWQDVTSPQFVDLPVDFSTTQIGFTGFIRHPSHRLGLRANIDTGPLTSFVGRGSFLGYDNGSARYYDIAIGMPIMAGSVGILPFLGYGGHRADFSSGSTVITRMTTAGIVVGADVWVPLGHGPWYLAGNYTFGSGQHAQYINNPGQSSQVLRAEGRAAVSNYSAAIGYRLPNQMTMVEFGWLSKGFQIDQITTGDTTVNGQDVRWQGYFLAFGFRR